MNMLKIHNLTSALRILAVIIVAFFPCMYAPAQLIPDSIVFRPAKSSYMLEFGSARLADTYLTPLSYDGWHAGFYYDRMQAMKFSPEKWTMQLNAGLKFDRTQNPARNATMLNLAIDASWGMLRRFSDAFTPGLSLAAGPQAGINAGCLYLSRNGNNPASAKAAITLNVTALAAYKTRIGHLPLTFSYQPSLACLGVFFSPDYGQLYYQIYLGERSGLTHCAWWGDYFALDNRVNADIHLGSTTLRLGYHGNLLSTKVNNLVTNAFTHSFTIGVTLDWIALRAGKPDNCIPAY